MKHWSNDLPRNSCRNAVKWAKTQPSLKEAWKNCERGDWIIWQLCEDVERDSPTHRQIVSVIYKCVRFALPQVLKDKERSLQAIPLIEKWIAGNKVSKKELREASDAAYKAFKAYEGYAGYNSYEAYPEADVTYAVFAMTCVVMGAAVADMASYAADAITFAAFDDDPVTFAETLKACADIVRAEFPEPPKL